MHSVSSVPASSGLNVPAHSWFQWSRTIDFPCTSPLGLRCSRRPLFPWVPILWICGPRRHRHWESDGHICDSYHRRNFWGPQCSDQAVPSRVRCFRPSKWWQCCCGFSIGWSWQKKSTEHIEYVCLDKPVSLRSAVMEHWGKQRFTKCNSSGPRKCQTRRCRCFKAKTAVRFQVPWKPHVYKQRNQD